MATLILVIIFIDFIGLGVPDSLLGAAWPAIYPEFVLPVSTSSILSIINVCGTITSSLLSSRLINRFGTAKVTAVSTVLTAIALGGFSISKNIYFLCLFSVPLGLGGGAIDTALNNYVALHYKATHMSFLHCFYGIGVSLSPYLMSIALSKDNNWRLGYRYAFFIQLTISLITIISIPLWKKANTISTFGEKEEVRSKNISLLKLAKMPTVRLVWIMFLCSCTIRKLGQYISCKLQRTHSEGGRANHHLLLHRYGDRTFSFGNTCFQAFFMEDNSHRYGVRVDCGNIACSSYACDRIRNSSVYDRARKRSGISQSYTPYTEKFRKRNITVRHGYPNGGGVYRRYDISAYTRSPRSNIRYERFSLLYSFVFCVNACFNAYPHKETYKTGSLQLLRKKLLAI